MCVKSANPPFRSKFRKKKIRKDLGEGNHKKLPRLDGRTAGGRGAARARTPRQVRSWRSGHGSSHTGQWSRCPAGRSVGPRPSARKVNGRMEPENGRRQRRRLASRHARHVRPRARSIGRWSPPCTHAARYSGSRILGTGAGTLAWPHGPSRHVRALQWSGRHGPGQSASEGPRAVKLYGAAVGPLPGYPPSRVRLLCIGRSPTQARNAAPRRAAHSKVETRLARSRPTEGNQIAVRRRRRRAGQPGIGYRACV